MGYNVSDIIDKTVNITIRRRSIYKNIEEENFDNVSIKIISKVLIKQMDKTIEYYETLLKGINKEEFEEIDFSIYDQMSSLISDFNKRIDIVEITSVKEYLEFSLCFEKAVYSLLINIKGRFVKNTSDIHTKTYKILTGIIDNKTKHIEMLEKTLAKIWKLLLLMRIQF